MTLEQNNLSEKMDLLFGFVDSRNYICPNPNKWIELQKFMESNNQTNNDRFPPPLILGAWGFTEDWEKRIRLKEQMHWAEKAGLLDLMDNYLKHLEPSDWHS
jgi:hypothetical protein